MKAISSWLQCRVQDGLTNPTHHSHFRCRGGQRNVVGATKRKQSPSSALLISFLFLLGLLSSLGCCLMLLWLLSFLLFLATCNHNRRTPEEKRNAHSALSRTWISVSPKSASFKPLALYPIITQRGRLLNSKSSVFTYSAYQQLCRTATHQAYDISSTI